MSGSSSLQDSNADKPEQAQDHPLGLTVYDLPTPGVAMDEEVRRKGRWKVILIMLICASPVIASYFTYYVIRPEGRRNFGELIEPQRAMPDLMAADLRGQPQPLRELQGQWLLLSVGGGHCQAACAQQLYFQRQLREGLGKEKDRLDRVWLINDAEAIPSELQAGLKDATVLRVSAQALADWLQPAAGHSLEEHLYLIDPQGRWMMRFPAALDIAGAAKAKRDLERLMRASASWDKAGR